MVAVTQVPAVVEEGVDPGPTTGAPFGAGIPGRTAGAPIDAGKVEVGVESEDRTEEPAGEADPSTARPGQEEARARYTGFPWQTTRGRAQTTVVREDMARLEISVRERTARLEGRAGGMWRPGAHLEREAAERRSRRHPEMLAAQQPRLTGLEEGLGAKEESPTKLRERSRVKEGRAQGSPEWASHYLGVGCRP